MSHPDFAVCPDNYYDHGLHTAVDVERARSYARVLASLTAAPPAAVPANGPATTPVGSACLATETHGPAL